MSNKKRLVYVWSLRNAGQWIQYKDDKKYMMSVLEYLVGQLNTTALGERYTLAGVIFDDDVSLKADAGKLKDYGVDRSQAKPGSSWLYPATLEVQGQLLDDLLINVPSDYRQFAIDDPKRIHGKDDFEQRLQNQFDALQADVVMLDGLLMILSRLADERNPYFRKIVNIHPGITQIDSIYQRRGATATWDALYGARGEKIVNWHLMTSSSVPTVSKTGASFHFVDQGIDSGPVIVDVLNTDIAVDDTILELRWNNFQNSLFPAMVQGLTKMVEII